MFIELHKMCDGLSNLRISYPFYNIFTTFSSVSSIAVEKFTFPTYLFLQPEEIFNLIDYNYASKNHPKNKINY